MNPYFSAVEVLDEHGVAMMKALGQWFSTVYFGKEHKLLHKEETFKWRSSKSDRAIESGRLYICVFVRLISYSWFGKGLGMNMESLPRILSLIPTMRTRTIISGCLTSINSENLRYHLITVEIFG
jgi:hypothetical protein